MMSEAQETIEEFLRQDDASDLTTKPHNRNTYSDQEMGSFSDWHRHELPEWYPWSDIDYVGTRLNDDGTHEPYILLELKELPAGQFDPFEPSDPPTPYQIGLYRHFAKQFDLPAFVLYWHQDKVTEFVVTTIRASDERDRFRLSGYHQFCDFLDRYRLGAEVDDD